LKIVLIISFCFLSILSCSEKKEAIPNCQDAEKLAKSDFEKGKYIYYVYQDLTDDKSFNKEFSEILKSKNITVIYKTKYPPSCIIEAEENLEKSKKCYQRLMNLEMEAKFGNPFFDSIRIEAKKTHKN